MYVKFYVLRILNRLISKKKKKTTAELTGILPTAWRPASQSVGVSRVDAWGQQPRAFRGSV